MEPKIVKGHEIWMELTESHFHKGEEAVVKAGWGHGMKPDGLGEKERWNAYLLTPTKKRLKLPILESRGGEEYYLLSFRPEEGGFYTIVIENDFGIGTKLKSGDFRHGPKRDYENVEYSTYFYQYAKALIPIGHPKETSMEGVGNELEIIPLNLSCLQFEVIYEGKPLPEAKLEATYSTYERKDFPLSAITNQKGRAKLPIDKKDNWLFRVSYTDETKNIEGFYDRIRLTATLTIPIKQ